MNTNNSKVETFFNSYAIDFDSIYGDGQKRSGLTKIADKLFRQSMFNRYKLTIEFILSKTEITTCIDVGTGPGRYCIDISNKNIETLGVDVSSEMIKLANSKIPDKIKHLVKFECADYMDFIPSKKYDVSILMGFFDYIKQPEIVINKLMKDTDKFILASFPKIYEPLSIQRYIRYTLNKCPLYLYSKNDLVKILKKCGINKYKIINNHREFFLIADVK